MTLLPFCLDIISLRNTSEAVKDPIKEINKIYSKEINAFKPNRPFSSISYLQDTISIELILLPHQVIVFPFSLLSKISWPIDLTIEEYEEDDIRYFFLFYSQLVCIPPYLFDIFQNPHRR